MYFDVLVQVQFYLVLYAYTHVQAIGVRREVVEYK
jgi:hypothetical protein